MNGFIPNRDCQVGQIFNPNQVMLFSRPNQQVSFCHNVLRLHVRGGTIQDAIVILRGWNKLLILQFEVLLSFVHLYIIAWAQWSSVKQQ